MTDTSEESKQTIEEFIAGLGTADNLEQYIKTELPEAVERAFQPAFAEVYAGATHTIDDVAGRLRTAQEVIAEGLEGLGYDAAVALHEEGGIEKRKATELGEHIGRQASMQAGILHSIELTPLFTQWDPDDFSQQALESHEYEVDLSGLEPLARGAIMAQIVQASSECVAPRDLYRHVRLAPARDEDYRKG